MRIINGMKHGFIFLVCSMILFLIGCSGSEKFDHYVVNLNGGEFVREVNGQTITIRHLKTPNSVIISCEDFLNNWYKIAGGDLLYSKAGQDPVKLSAVVRVLENGDIELMGSEIFVDGRENGVYQKKNHAATVVRKIDYEEEKINILQDAISHDYDWLLGTWSIRSRDYGTLEITFNEDYSCTQRYEGDNQLGLYYIDNGVLTTQGFGGTYYLNPSSRSISHNTYVSRGYMLYEVRENLTKIANIARHMEPTDIFSHNGEVAESVEPVDESNKPMLDEVLNVYKQPFPDIEDTNNDRERNENKDFVINDNNIQSTINESAINTKNTNNEDESGRLMSNDVKEKEVKADNSEDENLAEDNEIYQVVEEMPEFPDGGMAGLMKWLSNNIQYPAKAREEGTQGRVTMQFVVNRDGSISDAQVLRGVDPNLDKEALRLINSMPKWKPGMQRGKPVRVRYSVPVNFRL